MGDNLKQKTITAVKWSAIDRFGQQVVQFLVGLVLARLLNREDIGLFGSIAIFTALSYVFVESGFTQALIRKQNVNETDYNTVFYFNLFVSIVLYIILFFSAPLIATFFKQPQLVSICRVVFLTIPISSLYLVPLAQLNKTMDFKGIAISNVLAVFLSGIIGVTFALKGYGVWSLIAQQIVFQTVRMIVYYLNGTWRPKLQFSFGVILELWKFSLNIMGTSVLNVIFNNLYLIILGRYYSVKQVGDYYQANRLSEPFNYTFLIVLTTSSYPLFVQVQDDNSRFRNIYRSMAQKSSMLTFPVMITLIAIAYPLIYVLLSPKWLHSVTIFQLLIASSLFNVLYSLTVFALNAKGKSSITLRLEIIKKAMILLSVLALLNFGITMMLVGYAIVSFIAYLVSILYLKKEINHYIKHQIQDFAAPVLVGIFIASVCFGLSFFINNMYALLLIQLMIAVCIYILWIKKFYTEIFDKAFNTINEKIMLRFKKN